MVVYQLESSNIFFNNEKICGARIVSDNGDEIILKYDKEAHEEIHLDYDNENSIAEISRITKSKGLEVKYYVRVSILKVVYV